MKQGTPQNFHFFTQGKSEVCGCMYTITYKSIFIQDMISLRGFKNFLLFIAQSLSNYKFFEKRKKHQTLKKRYVEIKKPKYQKGGNKTF